jgi:hypothetical protein
VSGTEQVQQTIIGKHPGEDDAEAQRFYNQKIVTPVVLAMRNTLNQLTGAVFTVTEDSVILVKYGLILADASNGAIVLELRPPAESHRGYEIVKTDGTANSVTIRVVDGSLISGNGDFVLVTQWDAVQLASDTDQYVVTSGPPAQAAVLGPDVTGSLDTNKVVAFQNRAFASTAPLLYQLIRSLDGATWAPAYEGYPEATALVTFPTTGGPAVNAVAFTVPASPTGAGRFVLQRVYVRLETAMGGGDTGTVNVRVGSTVGGNEFATDQPVVAATTVGTIFSGLSAATRGASLLVANLYEGAMAAGATVNITATLTGVGTAGSCRAYVFGAFLP